MKKIAILGSTGSIGTQTLDVVRNHPDKLEVIVLAAHGNHELIEKQIEEFKPQMAILSDEKAFSLLQKRYKGSTKLLVAEEGLVAGATHPEVDTVVTSLMGFAGLRPTVAAIKAGKNIALANKETLVVAGDIIMKLAKEYNSTIMPIDSEHGALFQCLNGERKSEIKKLLITASGGPFRGLKTEELAQVTVEQCLAHPTWNMGQKITIDSASLMNKGLEVIEAKHLYDVAYDDIQVVVHPQSMVHSMVEFIDGSIMAQIASTDMRLPIQYALSYPERWECSAAILDFWAMKDLQFMKPDMDTFKGLKIAYAAGKKGGSMPCVMNAANEVAVAAFLQKKISFLDIYKLIEEAMAEIEWIENPNLEELFAIDQVTRNFVEMKIKGDKND